MANKHLDEARADAISAMRPVLHDCGSLSAVLVDDLFGRISAYVWALEGDRRRLAQQVAAALQENCAQFWTGTVDVSNVNDPSAEDDLFRRTAWNEGIVIDGLPHLRVNDRHRHHSAWFIPAAEERLWPPGPGRGQIIAFHGFKGGAGRTTLLAGYALACARRGQRVAVVDMDLDAPGIGLLLAADEAGTIARWGTVDYLLESIHDLPLDDYFHVCADQRLTGAGRIEVFPAGRLDDTYLSKLSRVELELRTSISAHPLATMLRAVHEQLRPDVILLDGRAGLSPAAGLLLSGIAHLHVLVATSNVQSLAGLERVVRHLGFEQALHGLPQHECVVVQAHVPDDSEVGRIARATFDAQVEAMFRNGYYARTRSEEDDTWSLDDLGSQVAPHVPVPISYRGRLAHFTSIHDVVDLLVHRRPSGINACAGRFRGAWVESSGSG